MSSMFSSGKSTIADLLVDLIPQQTVFSRVLKIDFDDYEMNKYDWNESSYHKGRQMALDGLSQLLTNNIPTSTHPIDTIIVIDDLNHLKSMRRDIYVIGRERRWSCVTVHISVSLQTALSRNASRQIDKVDEDTIHKIFRSFESPMNSHCIADQCHFIIDGEASDVTRSIHRHMTCLIV